MSALTQDFEILRPTCGEQSKFVSVQAVVLVWIFGQNHQPLFENLLRFGTIVRRRLAIATHHLELEDNFLHCAFARHFER